MATFEAQMGHPNLFVGLDLGHPPDDKSSNLFGTPINAIVSASRHMDIVFR